MFPRLATAIILAALGLGATEGAADLRKIRSLELDPERCYRVRDVFLEREDVKLYFTDAHLIFAKPCLLYTSPSPRDRTRSRMPSSA